MTQEWGAPLTGEQMKLLRAAGLPDGTPVLGLCDEFSRTAAQFSFNARSPYYCIPADHVAYTLLEAGWLDGRNARLWFGGDKAPDDWDGGDVLIRNGGVCPSDGIGTWKTGGYAGDIIAYIAKDESAYPPDGGLKDQVREPSECQSAFQTIAETVTIAKMTGEAGQELAGELSPENWRAVYVAFKKLGLITTRAERFWQGKERHSLYRDESARSLIDAALEFER